MEVKGTAAFNEETGTLEVKYAVRPETPRDHDRLAGFGDMSTGYLQGGVVFKPFQVAIPEPSAIDLDAMAAEMKAAEDTKETEGYVSEN